MRYTFGQMMIKYMDNDPLIYIVVADIGFGIFTEIKEKYPDRILNVGIAEQAMIGVAAGLAMQGLKPVCYTITSFLLERPFEAIKLNVCQQKQNVKLVSYGDYPDLGPTHISSDVDGLCKCLKLKLYRPDTLDEMINNVTEMMKETTPSFMYLKKANKLK